LSKTQPTIKSGVASELKRYCVRRNLEIAPLLVEAGLSDLDLDDPLRNAPLNGVMSLFEAVSRALSDPWFGVNFAQAFRAGTAGLLGHLVLASATVREMLVNGIKYRHVFVTDIDASFVEEDGLGHVSWQYPSSITASRCQFDFFIMTTIVLRLRLAAGPDWRPLLVRLQSREPDGRAIWRQVYGDRAEFNAACNELVLDSRTLSRQLPSANPSLLTVLRHVGDQWIGNAQGASTVAAATGDEIATRLKQGAANLDAVATAMGISSRALQWRLEQEGTSFEKVLNSTRARIAEHLLRDTDRSLTQIAFDLGFSDSSAFSRAAHRWFEMTPRAFRQQHRRGGSPD